MYTYENHRNGKQPEVLSAQRCDVECPPFLELVPLRLSIYPKLVCSIVRQRQRRTLSSCRCTVQPSPVPATSPVPAPSTKKSTPHALCVAMQNTHIVLALTHRGLMPITGVISLCVNEQNTTESAVIGGIANKTDVFGGVHPRCLHCARKHTGYGGTFACSSPSVACCSTDSAPVLLPNMVTSLRS